MVFDPVPPDRKPSRVAEVPSLKVQGAWLLFAKVVGFIFSFLLPLLVVRYLSKDAVGTYRQVFLLISTVVAVLPVGIGMSAHYYLAREGVRRDGAILNILLFNFVLGGLAFLVMVTFRDSFGGLFRNPEISQLAPLIGAVIWIWTFSSFLEIVAVANQEPALATLFIVFAQATKMALMLASVVIFATVDAFVYAALLQGGVQAIVLLAYICSRFPSFWRRFDRSFFIEQVAYAVPFGFAALLWTLQTDMHNYFVAYRFTPAEFAIYAYGCFQLPLIGMVTDAVASVLIPRMSALEAVGDKAEVLRLSFSTFKRLSLLFFPVYGFLVVSAHTFITTLFTDAYSASVPIFLIYLTLVPFAAWICDPVLRAYKELGRFLLKLRVVIFILLGLVLYYAIQSLSLWGVISIVVAVALLEKTVLTLMIFRTLNGAGTARQLGHRALRTAGCTLIPSLLTAGFYWASQEALGSVGASVVHLLFGTVATGVTSFASGVSILTGGLLFFSPIYLFMINVGVLERDEKQEIKSRVRQAILKVRPRFAY